MRRGLVLVLAMLIAILAVAAGASAVSCTLSSCPSSPTLVLTFGGGVSPRKLPRNDYVPVVANIFGKIAMSDSSHPPALREAVVDIDKDIKARAGEFAVCHGHESGVREGDGGRRRLERLCHSAIIGRGTAEAEIAFPEQEPIKVPSPLVVFNGGIKDGKVTLVIHTVITVPAPTAIVTTVTITRKGTGLHAVVKVPVITGGRGSLLGFHFRLGKTRAYKGKKVGYLEAKCPDGAFKVNYPELLFKNEAQTPGAEARTVFKGSQTVPCKPYD